MWFLIKVAFWFSVVLVIVPVLDKRSVNSFNSAPRAGFSEAVNAASQVVSHVSVICLEKPDVCIKGAKGVQALGRRAKEGVRVAYDLLDDPPVDATKAARSQDLLTGSIAAFKIPVPLPRPKR